MRYAIDSSEDTMKNNESITYQPEFNLDKFDISCYNEIKYLMEFLIGT